MSGLALLRIDPETQLADTARDIRGFISLSSGLETPVLVSLFTDRRARPSDDAADRRGWWGDAHARVQGDQVGSLLWLLRRRQATTQLLRRAQAFAEDALRWLKTDGIAKAITVTVEQHDDERIAIGVMIERPDGSAWSRIWDQHGNEVT